MESIIKVCLAADRGYLQHLVVTMTSVLLNADEHDRFEFLILSDGSLQEMHFSAIRKLRDFELQIVRTDQLIHRYMKVSLNPQWSEAVYYRLVLPYLCDSDEKIIYLDCDVVVRASLSPLWNLPLKESIAGVVDIGFDHRSRLATQEAAISGDYFNAGIAVWNLERIRARDYSALLGKAAQRLPEPEFNDQDWMNLMFETDKLILPPKWNAMSHLFSRDAKSMEPYTFAEIEVARSNPKICHFTNIKPWTMTYNEHPYWFEYWEILRSTPYSYLYPKGWFKKRFLTRNDSFFFEKVRPALKKLVGRTSQK